MTDQFEASAKFMALQYILGTYIVASMSATRAGIWAGNQISWTPKQLVTNTLQIAVTLTRALSNGLDCAAW
jgi:hypothetical protein